MAEQNMQGPDTPQDSLRPVAVVFLALSGLTILLLLLSAFLFLRTNEITTLLFGFGALAFGILAFVTGLAVLVGFSGARSLVLVTSIVLLFAFPVGTAIGAWALVRLFAPHKLHGARGAPPAQG